MTFVDQIIESAEALLKNPRIGRVLPEFNREDLREVIFRNYRIVYLLKDENVFILRVVHGSRDLTALVRREPWDISN